MMSILILSRSENVHADAVESYCRRVAQVDRINFDLESYKPTDLPHIILGSETEEPHDAFFVHHPRVSWKDEWFSDEIERKLFVASWDSVKEWMESSNPHSLWLNSPSANLQSKNVFGQLQVAKRLGFKVPETIFTNNLNKLQEFAGGEQLIIKQGNLGVHIEGKRILSSLVDVQNITKKDLQGAPCLFQKYVPKKYELRVHVVGSTVLACRIDSQANENTMIDWRNYDFENTPHEQHELGKAINDKCIELVRRMGLAFGVIDLIVTPFDELVFLECNAQGHWIWIEELTGMPITETISNYLIANGSK